MLTDLRSEREKLEKAWASYIHAHQFPRVSRTITQSWARSSLLLSPSRLSAPVEDPRETAKEWRDSLLYRAARPILEQIQRAADESGYIAAFCDNSGKLLWTHCSQHMRRRAEALVLAFPVWNFGYPAILKGFFDRIFLPGVAFDAISYAAGLTRMRFGGFTLATALGILPQTFLYSYLGRRAPEYVGLFLFTSGLVILGVVVFALMKRRNERRNS
jgi:hypothetical protein